MSFQWNVRPDPAGGYIATVRLPTLPDSARGGRPVALRTRAPTRGRALRNTINTATKVLSSPLLQSILPPGVGAALRLASGIGKAFRKLKLWGEPSTVARLRPELRGFARVVAGD